MTLMVELLAAETAFRGGLLVRHADEGRHPRQTSANSLFAVVIARWLRLDASRLAVDPAFAGMTEGNTTTGKRMSSSALCGGSISATGIEA
jgi:hypothetical protein